MKKITTALVIVILSANYLFAQIEVNQNLLKFENLNSNENQMTYSSLDIFGIRNRVKTNTLKNNSKPCKKVIEGYVTNKSRLIPGALVLLIDIDGNEINQQIVKKDAKFSFLVTCNSSFKIKVYKEFNIEESKIVKSDTDLKINLKTGTEKKFLSSINRIPLKQYTRCQYDLDLVDNIYFDKNESKITFSSARDLDRVIKIMKRCKEIKVIVSSHTDSRASSIYNRKLSQHRAQNALDYIVRVGNISKNRITAIGYGEAQLRNRCSNNTNCTEKEHEINRRTVVEISNF